MRDMRGRNCGMLIWPLKQNCEDGESRFIQWKWVVEDLWLLRDVGL